MKPIRYDLVEKYHELLRKYQVLLERLRSPHRERQLHMSLLGSWAMRGLAAGIALVRDDRILIANSRWWALKPRSGPFIIEGKEERTCVDLVALVAAMQPDGARPFSRSLRVRSVRAPEVVMDVYLESTVARGHRTTLVIAIDVTAQLDAERQIIHLREASQQRARLFAVGEVAAGVAHDLESTLQGLLLRLTLLERDAAATQMQLDHLHHLRFGLQSAAATVGKLRRLGSRHGETVELIDLAEMIDQALELGGLQFKRRGSHARLNLERSVHALPPVRARKSEVFHLLVNLLLNARDAMVVGGTVCVTARPTRFGARITIADEGPGFAAEVLPHVFDPFFSTKKARGTGLGLSLAHATMIELGGHISAANRPEGGALITLDFPRASSALADRPRKAKPAERSRPAARRSRRPRRSAPK